MATANSYDLIWEVDSYSPIFGYTLQFRKYVSYLVLIVLITIK